MPKGKKFHLDDEGFGMEPKVTEVDRDPEVKVVVAETPTMAPVAALAAVGGSEFPKRVGAATGPSRALTNTSGMKMPLTNIRFTPENHDYVRREAAMRGISMIDLVNWIVDQYKSVPGNVHDSQVYQDRDNW